MTRQEPSSSDTDFERAREIHNSAMVIDAHVDIEDLLAERGITVSHESIRLWSIKFGGLYARRLKRKHRGYGDIGI